MAERVLMGVDLGTTGVKVGLFDPDSHCEVSIGRCEYSTSSPHPDWVELEAKEYWRATCEATREAMKQAGNPAVVGVGLSSQGQTFVPLDEDSRPLRPAIVWLDTRAQAETDDLTEQFDLDEYAARTGHSRPTVVDSAPKILWIKRHEPQVWAQTRYIMMLPDYLGLRMTGERLLDINNARSTGLVDETEADWWEPGLQTIGIAREWLSPLGRACETIGTVTESAAEALGINEGCVVALGSNDQLNGAVGVANIEAGIASATVGTAMAIITTADEIGPDAPEGLLGGPHPVPGKYYFLSYAKTSGVILKWLRDLMSDAGDYTELLEQAANVPAGSDGLVCLPHFSGTATPTFRSDVRGAFVGLTLAHKQAHLARAVVEAVCYGARDALEMMARTGDRPEVVRTLGGATQSDFWMQVLSDVTGLRLEVPECTEAAVLGGAIFAGVCAGEFETIVEGANAFYAPSRVFKPDRPAQAAYDDHYAAYRDAMHRLYPGALGEDM
ncbi:MAG: xylulokinase [Armatimonadota bacterium]